MHSHKSWPAQPLVPAWEAISPVLCTVISHGHKPEQVSHCTASNPGRAEADRGLHVRCIPTLTVHILPATPLNPRSWRKKPIVLVRSTHRVIRSAYPHSLSDWEIGKSHTTILYRGFWLWLWEQQSAKPKEGRRGCRGEPPWFFASITLKHHPAELT